MRIPAARVATWSLVTVFLLQIPVTAAVQAQEVIRLAQANTAPRKVGISVKKVEEIKNPCELTQQRMKKVGGMALGGVLGFALCRGIGELVDKDGSTASKNQKAAACAVVGGIMGYNKAADSARRQCDLYAVLQQNNLDASFQQITVAAAPAQLSLQKAEDAVVGVTTLAGLSHFAPGSAKMTPEAQQYFMQIAQKYTFESQRASLEQSLPPEKRQDAMKTENLEQLRGDWAAISIALIGHTDDTGTDAINAELSERRAQAVAELFRASGIEADKLYFQGAGSSLPIADNRSEEGRTRNRRVEVIELPPRADVAEYLSLRRPNPDFFRPLPASTPAVPSPTPELATTASEPKAAVAESPPKVAATRRARSPATAARTTKPAPALPPLDIDFAGSPATDRNDTVLAAIGKPPQRGSGWGFISTAYASDDPIYLAPCTRDSPERNAGLPVKQLGTGRPVYKTNEYLPGFNDTAWVGSVNGHAVGLNHMAILRSGNEPIRNPDVLVYKDFDRTGDMQADLTTGSRVKVYEGDKGLLYRVFVEKSRLRCMDIVVRSGGSLDAIAGGLYYERNDGMFMAPYVPGRVRTQ